MQPTRRALLAAGLALGSGGVAWPVAAQTPLRVVGDRIFVDAVVNGRPTTAVLDSAAEMTVLDAAFAATLGLRGGTKAVARGTGARTTTATLVGGVALTIAGIDLRLARVAVIDLGEIARRLSLPRIDVIAGRELFDAARLAIELDPGELHVLPRSEQPPGIRLPLTMQRGIEAVPVSIEGSPALADFDLGNGGTVLVGAAYAQRHGLLDDRELGTIDGGGIGGAAKQTTLRLRSLDIAGRRFTNLVAAIDASPTAADANIGVRLLRRFGLVTDFPSRAVWLDFRG